MTGTHPMDNPAVSLSRTGLCLHYLLQMRAMVFGGLTVALTIAHYTLDTPLPWLPVLAILVLLAVFTRYSWLRIHRRQDVSESSFLAQLLVDVAALTGVLYFTGGSASPFVSLYLVPVVVAAATLRPAYIWSIAAAAAACYTGLMLTPDTLPEHAHGHGHFEVHVWGMWFGFLLSAAVVAYFVARIGATLLERDRDLASAREQALRNEQILALGTLAAGTAHELGTPLSTVAVLGRELEHEYDEHPELVRRLRLLRGQIDRCKGILARMASDAGQIQADAGQRQPLDRYLQGLIDDWRDNRAGVEVGIALEGPRPAPEVLADRTLSQAILNVLNNAADACSEQVQIRARWTDADLHLEVLDRGTGLAPTLAGAVGECVVSTKAPGEGMGIGLFLSRTILDRLGGTVRLSKRRGEGTRAQIDLPLSALITSK